MTQPRGEFGAMAFWALLFGIAIAVMLGGCFGEPPALATPSDDDDSEAGDDSSSSGTTAAPSSTSSNAGTGSTDESGSDDEAESFAPSSGDASSSSAGSSDASSSSGEPPYDGPYGDCWEGPVATEEGEYLCPPSPCVVSLPDHSACAPECGAGCEPGPGGLATVCLPTVAAGTLPEVCVMPCAGAVADCGDLECMDSGFEDARGAAVWMCMWGAP